MEVPSPRPSSRPATPSSPSPSRRPSPSTRRRPSPSPPPRVINISRRQNSGLRRERVIHNDYFPHVNPYSRPGRRLTYASREASLHGDSSSDVEEDAFEFTLADSNDADSGSESDAGGPLLTQDLRNAGESKQAAAAYSEADIYNVVESLYTGEGIVGGVQQAKLTVVRDRRSDQSTFYRWIHRTDESMVLKRFETMTLDLPELDDLERRAITKLFERVRQKFERQMPLSASSKAMEMDPDMIQEPISSNLKSSKKKETPRHVTWICVPFFLLRSYQGLDGYNSWEHPMRTLLQYRFASAQRTRDLQQAVCNLPGTPKDHCFRVAQLWCLILDDSTYAPIPQPSVASDVIKLIDQPKASLPGERPKRLLVSFGSSVLWSFNVADCPTWFALMRNFVEFWPRRTQLFYGKKEVTIALYPKILRRAGQFGAVQMKLSVSSNKLHVERIGSSLHQRSGGSDESAEPSETQPTMPGETGDSHPHSSAHLSPAARSSESCEYFVLLCANIGAGKEYSRLSSEEHSRLRKGLRRMDHFLSHGTPLKERVGYRHCPSAKYTKVLSELQQQEAKLLANTNDDENARTGRAMLSSQRDLFAVARAVYGIFAPTELDGPVIAKYWGALQIIFQSFRDESAEDDAPGDRNREYAALQAARRKEEIRLSASKLRDALKLIAEEAMCVKVLFSSMASGSSEEVKVPDEFVKAWLHIMVGVVLASSAERSEWDRHTGLALGLVRKGRAVLSSDLLQTSLTDHIVATPPAVAALIVLRFLRDVTPGDRSILNSYAEYMRILESRIDEKPLKQDHQLNLARVQEEMDSIRDILTLQSKVCQLMTIALASGTMKYERMHEQALHGEMLPPMLYHGTRAPQRQRYATYEGYVPARARRSRSLDDDIEIDYYGLPPGERKILPTDARGHQSIISQDCDRLVTSNMQGFEKLGQHADELQRMVSRKVKSNRERQDNAMYAFTIVTIVFLPLSTVAGIFGMNTSDIRDMDQPQWVFWAVAVPLWSIIIVLCLIWSGEWERFRGSNDGKTKTSTKSAGAAMTSGGALLVPYVPEKSRRKPTRR